MVTHQTPPLRLLNILPPRRFLELLKRCWFRLDIDRRVNLFVCLLFNAIDDQGVLKP